MNFSFPPIDAKADVEEVTRRMNISMQELVSLLDSWFVGEVLTVPQAPFEGMLVYTRGVLWNPGGGEGVYLYAGQRWWKLASSGFPRQVVNKDITYTANVYDMIAGDITDPVTSLQDTGSTVATTINLGGVGEASGDQVAVNYKGFNTATVNFGTGRVITMQYGDAKTFEYDGSVWSPL